MSFCYKVGTQVHTLSGFGLQKVWDGAIVNVLPANTQHVYLVVLGSISLDVDFRYYDDAADAGSLGVVSIDPTLALCDGSTVRGWHHTYDRSLHNCIEINRVTPVTGTYTFELWVSGSGTPGYCEWGTELLPGQAEVMTISEAMLTGASILVPALLPFAVAFGALIGLAWPVHLMCNGPPPDFPVFTEADWIIENRVPSPGGIPKLLQAWEAAVWSQYCRCVPPPTGHLLPAPPPAFTDPPGGTIVPVPPGPIVCDASDICGTLNVITNYLTTINSQVTFLRRDVQIIQRNSVAFTYVAGDVHISLAGAGTIGVQPSIGFIVTIDSFPGWLTSDMVPVPSYYRFGTISFGTADGWSARRIITHNPHLFLDVDPSVDRVAYQFEPGVTGSIREVGAQPT